MYESAPSHIGGDKFFFGNNEVFKLPSSEGEVKHIIFSNERGYKTGMQLLLVRAVPKAKWAFSAYIGSARWMGAGRKVKHCLTVSNL